MNPHTLTCSAGSADLPLPLDGLDSGPSVSVKSTPTRKRSSKKGSVRLWPTPAAADGKDQASGDLYARLNNVGRQRSIPTFTLSTEPDTEELTCSQEDFLASLSALPGSEEARQMTVRSGRRCSELLQRQDPLGCLVKTCLASSTWNSTVAFLTWKVSATPAGRLLFRLVPSMPSTDETECGLWRTPGAQDGQRGAQDGEERLAQGHAMSLASQVKTPALWPTPNVPNGGRTMSTEDVMNKGNTAKGKRQVNLGNAVKLWPTASARDWKSSNASPETMNRNSRPLNEVVTQGQGGSLNADWVEWLMGYPIGWTSLPDYRAPRKAKQTARKDSKDSATQ
jgi:hypothetical protein